MSTEQEHLFQENAGRTARLLIYGLVAIMMMAADQRGHYLPQLRLWTTHALVPIYETVGLPFVAINRSSEYFQNQHQLQQQLRALHQENLELRTQALMIQQLRSDNQELRELLGAQQAQELDVVYAELVKISLDPYSHRVVINRGSNDAIAIGQAVMDAQGVFGQVERVSAGGAEVILISDPNHALPVSIQRTGMRTLAYGTGNPNRLVLPDLPLNTDIQADDVIVTSGLGGHFPAGLPVGRVIAVDNDTQGDFASASATPYAGLDRSSQLVVINQRQVITQPASDDIDRTESRPEESQQTQTGVDDETE